MENTKSSNFKSEYKTELKEALLRESKGRLEIDVADNIATSYVDNLERLDGFNNIELMHKDPSAIASDMVNGMKPEMFKTE